MTPRQVKTMWVGLILLALLLIVPPWKFTLSHPLRNYTVTRERPGPYALVFFPPKIPVTSREAPYGVQHERYEGYDCEEWSTSIDWPRCLLPVGAVAMATVGLVVTFREKTSH